MAEPMPTPVPVPIARSPIEPAPPVMVAHGWMVSGRRSSAALTVADHTPLSKETVRAAPAGPVARRLAVPLGRTARRTPAETGCQVLVAGIGPGEWLLLGPVGVRPSLGLLAGLGTARDGELVTVVDVTHGRALVRVTGRRAADLLAKECGLDLGERVFPDGAACRTALAGLAVELIRDDRDDVPSYLVGCDRSSGQYLFDCLLDAGGELGAESDGFRAPGPGSSRRGGPA